MQKPRQSSIFKQTEIPSPDPSAYQELISDHRRSFKCLFPGCEKIFRFKSDMKRHIIIHTKDRPYTCGYPNCDRSFKRPDALKHHTQTHNEDFPFPCTIPECDSRFQKRAALQYHLEKHKNEQFFCSSPGCQRSFLTLKHLKQHQKAKPYHDKLGSLSQNSSQKDSNDLDCFFNHFDDLASEQNLNGQQLSIGEAFDEDRSEKSGRILHIEERGAVGPQDHTERTPQSNDLTVLMVCKYLFEENKRMKEKLAISEDSPKIKYENHLDSLLKKALDFKFDLNDHP